MTNEYDTEVARHTDASLGPVAPTGGRDRYTTPNGRGIVSFGIIERKQLVNRRTILWIFCSILFALFPIYSDLIKQMSTSGLDLAEILRKGEQFVIGGVVGLGAAGELLAASVPEELKNYSLTVSLCAILVAVANILAYVNSSTASRDVLIVLTIVIGTCTLVVSLMCVRTAAGR